MTETAAAFGAKTAKEVPETPSSVRGWEPSRSQSRACVPSLKRYRSSAPKSEEP
jgi:hypothetical protein